MNVQRRNLLRGKFSSSSIDVRLPWLKSDELFYQNCSQCYECIQACPANIVKKADGNYPSIDFKTGECTFCGECAQACPEELFNNHNNYKPWAMTAKVEQTCLSFHQISCRSCLDSCVYGAIKFELAPGTMLPPQINDQLCTACGACVSTCPVYAIDMIADRTMELTKGTKHVSQC